MDLNKILVPIDGSKKSFEALDRAVTLAGFTHGLTLLMGGQEQKHLINN